MWKATLRTVRPVSTLKRQTFKLHSEPSFITLPGTEVQSLSATRILPYKSSNIYALIADVDSYSTFVPYCIDSKVTKWSSPDKNGMRWPSEADLKVGWGGFEETFTSRLFCVPGSIVEALGGVTTTTLSPADIFHHSATFNAPARANSIFQSLCTRWTVKPFHSRPQSGQPHSDRVDDPAKNQSEIRLTIDFQFLNPIYGALSQAVAPRIAGIMIEAFEVRARRMLDRNGAVIREETPSGHDLTIQKKIGV